MVDAQQLNPAEKLAVRLRSAGAYFFQAVFVAWIGVFLISMVLSLGVGWLNERAAEIIFTESFYPGVIAVGLLLGYVANSFLRSKFVQWLWIPPGLAILSYFYPFTRLNNWTGPFNYLFLRKDCAECLESFLMVAPFYGSMAYSLGAWAALKRNSRRPASKSMRTS